MPNPNEANPAEEVQGQLESVAMTPTTKEVERKFRLSTDQVPFALNELPHKQILQGYLAISETGNEVRVRDKAGTYFLTCKSDGDLERSEAEIEIPQNHFEVLWPLTAGLRVEKVRYEIEYQGFTIELDVFSGAHEGLVLAEIEFSDVQQSEQFEAPQWLGRDVTLDKRYKNKNLAKAGVVPHE